MFRKIVSLNKLCQILSHRGGKRVVQCHGVFDLLHIGHIKHLQEAKRHGNILVVTIVKDKCVNKGLNRPFFNERLRAEALASLECVDYVVIINDQPNLNKVIKKIRPNTYCKGRDYLNRAMVENDAVKAIGGDIYITKQAKFSSTKILKKLGV